MNTYQANRYTQFITPLGGIIALTCFFLPWIGRDTFSDDSSGISFFVTKYILAIAPLIAIAFIMSVVIVGLSLYMLIRRTPWKSNLPTLISSGIGLSLLLDKYLQYVRLAPTTDFSYSGKFGFWGTIIGFVVAIIGAFLIRQENMNRNSEVVIEVKQPWAMVHAGGIVALFCFFMPWEGIGTLIGSSGFDLMKRQTLGQSLVTIAFIASILTVGISLYVLVMGTHWKLWKPILVCIGIGLGILLSYSINFYIDEIKRAYMLRELGRETMDHFIKFGFWGTVIGYVIAAVGMFLTTRKNRTGKATRPSHRI